MFREIRDMGSLVRDNKDIAVYSEGRNYYPNFEGLIRELSPICYITSDSGDPILSELGTYYLNRLLPFYMAFTNRRIIIMTMTDLNSFHIKRSIHPAHYVYIFHSLASTHMVYRYGAFDHYDSILCVGSHQVEEIRKHEKLHGLKPKNLVEAGYYGVERLHKAYKKHKKENKELTVLIAPTWGTTNLLEVCGEELIRVLAKEGYKITLRLHPETVKRHRFPSRSDIILETSVTNINSLVEADILITGWSAIGLEYAFGTERPVIFVDIPPKIRNPRYRELDIMPIESLLRDRIGVIVPPNELDSIPRVISDLISQRHLYRPTILEMRDRYVFNFGKSSEVGAEYIKGLLVEE